MSTLPLSPLTGEHVKYERDILAYVISKSVALGLEPWPPDVAQFRELHDSHVIRIGLPQHAIGDCARVEAVNGGVRA